MLALNQPSAASDGDIQFPELAVFLTELRYPAPFKNGILFAH